MKTLRLLALFLSLYFTLNQLALASTIVTSSESEQDISRDFTAYVPTSTTGVGSFTQEMSEKGKGSLRLGYFRKEKWAGITLANPTDQPLSKWLYFDTLTGFMTLYQKKGEALSLLREGGSSQPFQLREVKSIFTAFKLTLPPKSETELVFKVHTRHNFNSKIFLGNLDTLKAREDTKLGFMSFYLGGILCLIVYNLFIYFFLKDKNYLYYCFFAASFLFPILAIHGLLDKYFANTHFSFSHYLICYSSSALFFATLFTEHFLEIKKHFPKCHGLYQFFKAVALGLILIGLTPVEDYFPQIFGHLIDLSIVVANAMFIFSAVKLIRISTVARFYLFSWMVVFMSLISWFGMTFGYFPNNFFTQHSLLYANLGQMLTLSLALAFRIHQLTQEKTAAEEKAMQKEKYHRLVRVLSHDIANSLTIINSYSKKMIKPRQLDDRDQRVLEKIYFASENIKNILNNVREEELLSIRKKELGRELVSIDEILRNASLVFEDHLRMKNITLHLEVDKSHKVWANKTCFLNNIVNNILSNSIKFSFENSRIEVVSSLDSENIKLTFTDYGRGVKQELINDIFFSNRLISSEGTNAEVGHGFGTTLMREYVQLFNGRMEVQSQENETFCGRPGTVITLLFPLPVSN